MACGSFAGVVIRASRATVMRSARPELIDIVRQVRTAVAWAFACSGFAAMLALALPVLVLHVMSAIERKTSFDALALTTGATLAALVIRAVLLGVRQQVLTSAALWGAHVMGQHVLARGLVVAETPSHLDRDQRRLDRGQTALAGPALAALLDAPFFVFPLALLLWLQPALALVTLGLVCILLGSCLRLARAAPTLSTKARAARTAAHDAWRTAAASSVIIEARGMTAGVVHDWQSLNSRAIAIAYAEDRRLAVAMATLRLSSAVGPILLLGLGSWLVATDGLTIDVLVVALVLNAMVVQAIGGALASIVELTEAQAALTGLLTDRLHPRADASLQPSALVQRHAPAHLPSTGLQLPEPMRGVS
jgi:ABC-type protease/lipase transport system fused ATPase/permease subunit